MLITVEIKKCTDCRHLSHSGVFTKGGSKPVCHHDDAVKSVTKTDIVPKEEKVTGDRFHWKHRVPFNFPKIPDWCPLKSGSGY